MYRTTSRDQVDFFLAHETYWPKGARKTQLRVIAFDHATVAFSYAEPIAVHRRGHRLIVVSHGTLDENMPGVYEWSMATSGHISTMMGASYRAMLRAGTLRASNFDKARPVRRLSRERLHAALGWSCPYLPAVVRVNRIMPRMNDNRGARIESYVVDSEREPVQWHQTRMGMYG